MRHKNLPLVLCAGQLALAFAKIRLSVVHQQIIPIHPRQLMGGFDPRTACGQCQLYMWVHAGKSAARSSDVFQVRA